MGLFSSKKKEHVSNVAMRLLDDKDFKYSHQLAMNDYLFKQVNLSQAILDHHHGALPRKLNRTYKLADKSNRYVFGLPKDSILSEPKSQITNVVTSYLSFLENQSIRILHTSIGELLPQNYVWDYLIKEFEYNSQLNQLKYQNTWVYLFDVDLYLTESTLGLYDYIDDFHTGLGFDFGSMLDRVQDTSKNSFNFLQGNEDKAVVHYATYQQVRNPNYTLNNGEPEFIQEKVVQSFDLHLDLNPKQEVGDVITDDKDYVQVVYQVGNRIKFFIYGFGSGIFEIDTSLNVSNGIGEYYPRLYTRLNYKDIVEHTDEQWQKSSKRMFRILDMQLKKTTKQLNKAIGNELNDTVYMYFDLSVAINKDTWDRVTGEYLFRYFFALYGLCKPITATKRQGITQCVADNVTQQYVSFDSIDMEILAGVAKHQVDNSALSVGEYSVVLSNNIHEIIYQHKANEYQVIRLIGLRNTHSIYGKNQTISGHDENLTIPLDKALVDVLSNREKEKLLYKCLHVQIGIRKVVKLKWYQTGIFKVVMAVVGIAIAYFTAGTGASLSTVLWNTITNTLTGLAITYGLDILLKVAVELGLDAKVVGAIAFVVSVVALSRGNMGNFSFKAGDIMRALNTSLDAHNKVIGLQIQQVQKEMAIENKQFKDQSQLLKRKQEMLLTKTIPLDLEMLASPVSLAIWYESPSQLYNRTMTVDVKDITLNVAHEYVAMTRRLPDYQSFIQSLQKKNQDDDVSHLLLV